MERPGVELVTSRSQVRRPHRYTTEPAVSDSHDGLPVCSLYYHLQSCPSSLKRVGVAHCGAADDVRTQSASETGRHRFIHHLLVIPANSWSGAIMLSARRARGDIMTAYLLLSPTIEALSSLAQATC